VDQVDPAAQVGPVGQVFQVVQVVQVIQVVQVDQVMLEALEDPGTNNIPLTLNVIVYNIYTVFRKKTSTYIFTCVSYAEARLSYRLDVRLPVSPSVTRWYCIKTAEHIVMLSSPHDSSFVCIKIFAKFRLGHPLRQGVSHTPLRMG